MVLRDNNIEAVAHYKGFKALQYHEKASVASEEDKQNVISKSLELYEEASKFADENRNLTHLVRLFIKSEFSKFHCCILDSVVKAIVISKEAYENGLNCLTGLSGDLKCSAE